MTDIPDTIPMDPVLSAISERIVLSLKVLMRAKKRVLEESIKVGNALNDANERIQQKKGDSDFYWTYRNYLKSIGMNSRTAATYRKVAKGVKEHKLNIEELIRDGITLRQVHHRIVQREKIARGESLSRSYASPDVSTLSVTLTAEHHQRIKKNCIDLGLTQQDAVEEFLADYWSDFYEAKVEELKKRSEKHNVSSSLGRSH